MSAGLGLASCLEVAAGIVCCALAVFCLLALSGVGTAEYCTQCCADLLLGGLRFAYLASKN